MAPFTAQVEFRFESASLEAAGTKLRQLHEAALATGFELRHVHVTPAPEEDEHKGGWTSYAPLPNGE